MVSVGLDRNTVRGKSQYWHQGAHPNCDMAAAMWGAGQVIRMSGGELSPCDNSAVAAVLRCRTSKESCICCIV